MAAADALVEKVIHALGVELIHQLAAGVGGLVVRLADDEMIFHGYRPLTRNDSGGGAVGMARPGSTAQSDKWWFVSYSFVASPFGNPGHFLPNSNVARMNIATERTGLWVAVGDNTPNMHFKIIADSRPAADNRQRPAFRLSTLRGTASGIEEEDIHIRRVIEYAVPLDGLYFRQITDLLTPMVLKGS